MKKSDRARAGQGWTHDRMTVGFALAAVALLAGTAGCNNNSSATAATTPTVTRTTDTFTGTVQIAGSDFHSFPVATTGQIDVTLTAAGPPSTIVMGVSVGTPTDVKCTALAGASVNVSAGAPGPSGLVSAGTLCVDVHDVGNQSAPVSYTVTVTHP